MFYVIFRLFQIIMYEAFTTLNVQLIVFFIVRTCIIEVHTVTQTIRIPFFPDQPCASKAYPICL